MIVTWTEDCGIGWRLVKDLRDAKAAVEELRAAKAQDVRLNTASCEGHLNTLSEEMMDELLGDVHITRVVPEEGEEAHTPKEAGPVSPRVTKKDMRDVESGTWYRAATPLSLARRLYGSKVKVQLEHSPAYQPAYRMWMVVQDGALLGRIYEPIYQFEQEAEE